MFAEFGGGVLAGSAPSKYAPNTDRQTDERGRAGENIYLLLGRV